MRTGLWKPPFHRCLIEMYCMIYPTNMSINRCRVYVIIICMYVYIYIYIYMCPPCLGLNGVQSVQWVWKRAFLWDFIDLIIDDGDSNIWYPPVIDWYEYCISVFAWREIVRMKTMCIIYYLNVTKAKSNPKYPQQKWGWKFLKLPI